jgi:hypothetical protein
MMPLRAFRQLAWGRPVALVGQNTRRIGRILCQKSSETSQIVGRGLTLLYWFSENWKFAFEALAWFRGPIGSLFTL